MIFYNMIILNGYANRKQQWHTDAWRAIFYQAGTTLTSSRCSRGSKNHSDSICRRRNRAVPGDEVRINGYLTHYFLLLAGFLHAGLLSPFMGSEPVPTP